MSKTETFTTKPDAMKTRSPYLFLPLFLFLFSPFGNCWLFAQTNPSVLNLPVSEDFGTATFTALPSGFAAWTVNSSPVGNQTNAENSTASADASISARTTSTSTGGCFGYATAGNGRFYVQTSSNSTNGSNQLVASISTEGLGDIDVSYDVEMIRAQPRPIGVVLQYRVGTSGGWTTVGDTVYEHSSANRTDGDVDQFADLRLPSAANNQAIVQVRWAVWRSTSAGNSCGIAIDNISISGQAVELRYFRTAQSGAWGNTATWEVSTDSSSWNPAPAAPSYLDHTIYIRMSHTVTLSASDTIDQVVVEGSLVFSTTASGTPIIHNGHGTDLIVNGTFEDQGPTSINWETGSTWAMGASATLLRTRSTSSNNWRDHYKGGINQIPATGHWVVRKVGSDSPTLSTTDGMHYPNLTLENYSGSLWETGFQSSFTGFLTSPVIKGNLNVGGPNDDGVSFLNSNTHPNPVLVKGNLKVKDESTLRNHGRGFEIWGDATFEGSYDADTGLAMIVLSGVADQQVFSLSTLQVAGIRVSKASGKVKLSANVVVSDTLALENGIVVASAGSTIRLDVAEGLYLYRIMVNGNPNG